MFANPNLIYYDAFVFCSIPRLFVCLRMRISTSKQYANVYVKSMFIGPTSIAGVPLSQAAPAYLITAHHLCAFLMYLARLLCGGLNKTKKKKDSAELVCTAVFGMHVVCVSARV